MTRIYLLASVMALPLAGSAIAQTAAPAPASAEAIIQMQINAGGTKGASGKTGAEEADTAYKRYIADIGRPMPHGNISSGSPSGAPAGIGAR